MTGQDGAIEQQRVSALTQFSGCTMETTPARDQQVVGTTREHQNGQQGKDTGKDGGLMVRSR